MRLIPVSLFAVLAATLPVRAGEGEPDETRTLAFNDLQRIVREEKRLLAHARLPGGGYELDRVKQGFQELVRKYEVFLGDNPDYAPGYVAYGLMLDRAGETDLASRMFLRANELDPNIPVVKNQLGNYMVENDRPEQALPYYLAAIELAPEEPLYHLQLGNLLAEYRRVFLDEGIYEADTLDAALQEAFRKAARLDEDEIAYAYRYAESYYDVGSPDWEEALAAWDAVGERMDGETARQTVRLQKANIHILNGKPGRAAALLEDVTSPALQSNKQRLLERLSERR